MSTCANSCPLPTFVHHCLKEEQRVLAPWDSWQIPGSSWSSTSFKWWKMDRQQFPCPGETMGSHVLCHQPEVCSRTEPSCPQRQSAHSHILYWLLSLPCLTSSLPCWSFLGSFPLLLLAHESLSQALPLRESKLRYRSLRSHFCLHPSPGVGLS